MKLINRVLTAKGRDITVIFNCLNSQFETLLRLTSDKEMLHCALQNTENKERMLGYIRELLDINLRAFHRKSHTSKAEKCLYFWK